MGHKKYRTDFKLRAVQIARDRNAPVREVAQKLSVPEATLYKWVKIYKQDGPRAFYGARHPLVKEVERLLRLLKAIISSLKYIKNNNKNGILWDFDDRMVN